MTAIVGLGETSMSIYTNFAIYGQVGPVIAEDHTSSVIDLWPASQQFSLIHAL